MYFGWKEIRDCPEIALHLTQQASLGHRYQFSLSKTTQKPPKSTKATWKFSKTPNKPPICTRSQVPSTSTI